MSSLSKRDEDEDWDEEDALMNIQAEDGAEGELDEASDDSIDEDFLSELGKAKQTPFKRQLKYFVFLLKGSARKGVRIINLPHPKTGTSSANILIPFFYFLASL